MFIAVEKKKTGRLLFRLQGYRNHYITLYSIGGNDFFLFKSARTNREDIYRRQKEKVKRKCINLGEYP